MTHTSIHAQKGSGAVWFLIVMMGGVLISSALKLMPHFLDNRLVTSTVADVVYSPEVLDMSKNEIISKISKSLSMNNVRSVDADAIKVDHQRDRVLISVDYEVRVNLFSNIDAVAVFKKEFDSSKSNED